jgi:hypothetical protein
MLTRPTPCRDLQRMAWPASLRGWILAVAVTGGRPVVAGRERGHPARDSENGPGDL